MDAIAVIAGLALLFILIGGAEYVAGAVGRRGSPPAETHGPRYKPIWLFVGVVLWNAPLIPAVYFGGLGVAVAGAAVLLLGYGVLRYRLARSPSMQARFLVVPLSRDKTSVRDTAA